MFLLAFVSMGIFAKASNGISNSKPIKSLVVEKPSSDLRFFEEVGYEFQNDVNLLDGTVCVTVTYNCPDSPNGSGSGSCTKCATNPIIALADATICAVSIGEILCPA